MADFKVICKYKKNINVNLEEIMEKLFAKNSDKI